MSERLAPNPPLRYMCMWDDDEAYQDVLDMLSSSSTVGLTAVEKELFGKLLSRQYGIPSRLIITYPRGIWVAHITGEVEGVNEHGRLQRRRGARMIGHPHCVDQEIFVVDAVFPEALYPDYLSILNEMRG
jgi:hypothetical protein